MKRLLMLVFILSTFIIIMSGQRSLANDMDTVLEMVKQEISGNRARDYDMRLWQYDKWYTLPMMNKSAHEAQAIMKERGFDEAEIVNTPADGVTQYGTWTNPIGWDVKQATLEVIEPKNIPDEFKFLCNYIDNPTSLIGWSCPTPPQGLETELVLLDRANRDGLKALDAKGKIILTTNAGGMKRYLDEFGVPGLVSDQIEGQNSDFIDANTWFNTWSDNPGGWLMNASDSKNNFGFSISQKKANYLRQLLRRGTKVVVRAKIDSRYYTDGNFPYVTGCIKGTSDEEVLIVGHLFEWGANDNASGCASIIEAMGTLNDLIDAGKLPRPRRSIRCWMGQEIYGSLAFSVHNLEKLRKKTIAAVCCDTPSENYYSSTTAMSVSMSFNACPSFTDAVFTELAGKYYSKYAPTKLWKTIPYRTGIDNFFSEPMIGVPINAISMTNGGHLHHNSMDTIEKVDPRTLGELALLNAAYLYYIADAGYPEIETIANLTFGRGISLINSKTSEMRERAKGSVDGVSVGQSIFQGTKTIDYYTGIQKQALMSILRIVNENEKDKAGKYLTKYIDDIDSYGKNQALRFTEEIRSKAKEKSINIVNYKKSEGNWEIEAARIIPERKFIGSLTYDGIPVEETMGSPRWWSAGNWAAASYWWCDGKRNLNEIKELVELEAGTPVRNFDLLEFFRFLEKYGMVEFVKK